MEVEIVKDIGKVRGSGARQCLVKMGEEFFVVSSVTAFDHHQFETLVFRSNEAGDIKSWTEVAGGIGMDRAAAIADLKSKGPRDHAARAEIVEAVGGPGAFIVSTLSGEVDRLVGQLPEDTDDRF